MSMCKELRQFVSENFLYGRAAALTDDDSFLAKGIIDSTGVLELVNFLEMRYGIKVQDRDLVPENLDSINNVAKFVQRQSGESPCKSSLS